MTTTLDIVDTAVKIGLGALISGVTTFLMAKTSFKQDISKSMLNDKVSMLKESAIQTWTATNLINHSLHYFCFKNDSDSYVNIDSRIKDLIDAYDIVGCATVKCNMIGETGLAEELRCYGNLIQEIYQYCNSNKMNIKTAEINLFTPNLTSCNRKISDLFRKAYIASDCSLL